MINNLNDVRNTIGDFAKVKEVIATAKEKGLNCDDFTRKEFNAIFKGNKKKPGIISFETAKEMYFDTDRKYIRHGFWRKGNKKFFIELISIETKTLEKPISITRIVPNKQNNGVICLKENLTEVKVYHYKMNTDFANLKVSNNLINECKKVMDRARKKCEARLKQLNAYTDLIENS